MSWASWARYACASIVTCGTATFAQTPAQPIRSSFVAQGWFQRHVAGWQTAIFDEVRPVAYGEWTSGGGLFGSPLLSAGWSPAKVEHKVMIHCWRMTPAKGAPKIYLFVESLRGELLKVKSSPTDKLTGAVSRWCGP